jgi:hypothetical protein
MSCFKAALAAPPFSVNRPPSTGAPSIVLVLEFGVRSLVGADGAVGTVRAAHDGLFLN